MLPQATIKFSDIYGPKVPGRSFADALAPDVDMASGDFAPGVASTLPTIYWIGMVVILFAIRWLSREV